MTLITLVSYFRSGGAFDAFCRMQSLNAEAEVIEIFMRQSLDVDNELGFFELANTAGKVEYTFNEIMYFYLFDFYYFLDAIQASNSGEYAALSDSDIARRLYAYAISDA